MPKEENATTRQSAPWRRWLAGSVENDTFSFEIVLEKEDRRRPGIGNGPQKRAIAIRKRQQSLRAKALEFVQLRGFVTSKELQEIGLHRCYMTPMCAEGLLVRVGHGRYRAASAALTGIPSPNPVEEQRVLGGAPNPAVSATDGALWAVHPFIEALRIVPQATVGLQSALHFYGLIEQAPEAVCILLHPHLHWPKKPVLPLQVAKARGESLAAGIEHHIIDGVSIPITSPAKTVADCFKYQDKVDRDLAIRMLTMVLQTGRASTADVLHYAQLCRVRTAMWPHVKPFVPAQERLGWYRSTGTEG